MTPRGEAKANLTGGWWWHLRAWRCQRLWQPATDELARWWLSNAPRSKRLVLIGASAGWMMRHDGLLRYPEVETWDIDPWAERLFAFRHGRALRAAGVRWTHHHADAWSQPSVWLRERADSVFWFDNLLGQFRFAMPFAQARWRVQSVKELMRGTYWGSVHDRYSGPLMTTQEKGWKASWGSACGVDLNTPQAQAWLHAWGAHGHWLDHLTQEVFAPDTRVLNLAWPFKPDFGHWLEMGWQLP